MRREALPAKRPAGEGIANPSALMLAAAMMLDHVGHPELATRLRKGIHDTHNVDLIRTGDLDGDADTRRFTQALVARLRA